MVGDYLLGLGNLPRRRSSITCRAAKVMRKRPDIDISVCVPILMVKRGRLPTPLDPAWAPWGTSSCYLQTRHNYEISYPYEWGERLDKTPPSRFFWFCPSTTVPLTRYVRRVRELRQNVRFPFSLVPDSDPTVRLTYITSFASVDTAASANPFVQMKSVRANCVPSLFRLSLHDLCLVP
jgi:hypothetical protein